MTLGSSAVSGSSEYAPVNQTPVKRIASLHTTGIPMEVVNIPWKVNVNVPPAPGLFGLSIVIINPVFGPGIVGQEFKVNPSGLLKFPAITVAGTKVPPVI